MMLTTISEDDRKALAGNTHNLVAQEARCEIITEQDSEAAVDLASIISAQIKKADEKRKEDYTGPLNAVIKRINADFKAMIAPLETANTSIRGKLRGWAIVKEREAEKVRQEAAKKKEEEALELAESLEKVGYKESADRILEAGAAVSEVAPVKKSAPTRGDFGGVGSVKKTWAFEVEDIEEVPRTYFDLNQGRIRDAIRQAQRDFKAEAEGDGLKGKKAEAYVLRAMKEFRIPGVRVYQDVGVAIR